MQVIGTGATVEEAIANAAEHYHAKDPEYFAGMEFTAEDAVENLLDNGELELVLVQE